MRFPSLKVGKMCFPVIGAGNEVKCRKEEVNQEDQRKADASKCRVQR